jgi:hypothetical protein
MCLIKKLPPAPIDDIKIKAIDVFDQAAVQLSYRLTEDNGPTEGIGVIGAGLNFIL